MKLIFMGTPAFAVPTLRALLESRHEIAAVYTQPDRVKGRGRKQEAPPVKEFALAHGLRVIQPKKITKAVREEMQSLQADAIIVAAYGKILRKSVLEMTPFGCFNVHASLLPKYRGAAPIQWAIMNGESETGITIMQMNEGLDTGDLLLAASIPIADTDTGDSLTGKLAEIGGPLLLKVLDLAEEGRLQPVPQPEESPTAYAAMLDAETGRLDFHQPAVRLERIIRALADKPAAYCSLHDMKLKLFRAEVLEEPLHGEAGTVTEVTKQSFTVQTGEGSLKILELQLEGRKRMTADAFLRGFSIQTGDRLQ